MQARRKPFPSSESNNHRSGISLKLRLLLFLIVLVLTMVAGAIIILLVTGIFSAGIKESRLLVQQELNNKSKEISTQLEQLSLHNQSYAESVRLMIEDDLEEHHMTFSILSNQSQQIKPLLNELFSETLLTLQKSGASGIFIVFSNEASMRSTKSQMPGIYIRNENPDIAGNAAPSFLLLRGSTLPAYDASMRLDSNWSEIFTLSDLDPSHIPVQTLSSYTTKLSSDHFYLSQPTYIPGTKDRALYMIIPVMSASGEIYAYCGFELSAQLFQKAHLPSNIAYPRLCVLYSVIRNNQVQLSHTFVSGEKSATKLFPENAALYLDEGSSLFHGYYTTNHAEFLGLQQELSIYPESSPFYEEQPSCIVIVPKKDIISSITEFNILLVLLLLILVILGIIISIIFSNHYIRPISQSIELIRASNEEEAPKTNIQELDGLLSYLTDYKKQLQQKAEQEKHKISCLEQFADHAKALTPAEHCVFQLYIQKLTAKEIADTLCLSINTIKTHTKHIFSKLEISSREELLLYINMLEEIGYDVASLNNSVLDKAKES